jgi:hypothetical protein
VVAPTLAPELRTGAGTATLRQELAGAELGWRWRAGATFRPALAVGGGLHHVAVAGKEVAPLSAASDALWTPFVAGGAGLTLRLRPGGHLALQADVRAALVRRSARVRIGDTEAGRTGWPLLVAVVGLAYER